MALAAATLQIGRKNIMKVFIAESAKLDPQYKRMIGTMLNTTQVFEQMKQLKGLTPAQQINDGDGVPFEDFATLYTANFTPVIFAKGTSYTKLMNYTNQYKSVVAAQPAFARSFMDRRNLHGANLFNLGFTSTTMGITAETLFSTSHNMAGVTGTNRPAIEIALGPAALEQCLQELRSQVSAVNETMMLTGPVDILVPTELEGRMYRLLNTTKVIDSNDNDSSGFYRDRVNGMVCDYFTSATAWFARMRDNGQHGLFWLNQMPYDIERLPPNKQLTTDWVASESYIAGWNDWHGTWGTTGA